MARPRKAQNELRSANVGVRFTEAELALIEEQASRAGITPTEFIRAASLMKNVRAQPEKLRSTAITALLRLGVNLNQITRRFNMDTARPDDLAELRTLLADIRATMNRLEA